MLECALNEFYHTFEQFSIVLCADYTRFYNYTHFHRLSLLGRDLLDSYLKKKEADKKCRIQLKLNCKNQVPKIHIFDY